MHKNKVMMIVLGLIFLCNYCHAASLWLNGNDLYSSNGAARNYQPGDLITISISEESNATSKASTSTSKKATVNATTGPKIPIFKNVVDKVVGNTKFSNEFDGEGTTTRSGKLSGTVSATVLEVLANGNLLIEGSRSIVVNQETQIMRVRGIARPRDINSDNTINSKMLADAQIKYEGRGAVNTPNKKGLMTKFFDAVF
ncbi:MAG: flagellar basal body L-ring protein FlgH [Candidatus Riflebacteria bacterium]|nr:flagellar basal body L-ring protein FlgH [Candidatus Riflebacteria bacterium]